MCTHATWPPACPSCDHPQVLGYAAPNLRFVKGEIEDLSSAGIADGSVDLVIFNCVVRGASSVWCLVCGASSVWCVVHPLCGVWCAVPHCGIASTV